MELHHLRYFVAVAEERHFGRAAQRLHVTQPPVSQRIRDLERELGLDLFERSNRGIQLTQAGALLLEHARQVLREMDTTSQVMKQFSRGPVSLFRVGLPPDTLPDTIRVIMTEFAERVPDVALQFNEMATAEQLAELRSGGIDVAVVRRPVDGVGLETSETVVSPVGVWLSARDPLVEQASVRLSQFEDRPLVLFPREMAPGVYDRTLATCRDAGFLPWTVHHVRNPSFVRGLVLSGLGVHFNNRSYLDDHVGDVVFRPLEGTPLAWRSSVMWLPQRRSPITQLFAQAALTALIGSGYERLPVDDGDPVVVSR